LNKSVQDIIISDIGMPDMDGYELMRRVRSGGANDSGGRSDGFRWLKTSRRAHGGGHNTSPSPSHTQALVSSSFRTKTTDEEELLSNMGGKKMPNSEEDRHANRSEKSSFKPVESDQFQIGPRR
jgi:hypothetical protein